MEIYHLLQVVPLDISIYQQIPHVSPVILELIMQQHVLQQQLPQPVYLDIIQILVGNAQVVVLLFQMRVVLDVLVIR